MSTTTKAGTASQAAFRALIDYAGVFPPAMLAMEPAVDEYLMARDGPHAWMLGRFIAPASRLDELVTVLRRKDPAEPIAVSAIVDSASDPRRWFGTAQERLAAVALIRSTVPQLTIEALETRLPGLTTKRDSYDASIGQFAAMAGQAGLRDVPIYVELPYDARWHEALPTAMGALARARLGAKLRCGGAEPQSIPSIADVAAFVATATSEDVPYKATAGLHHPIRHLRVEDGAVMHGFLNLLAVAAFAPDLDRSMLEQVLAEEAREAFGFDEGGFTWRDLHVDVEAIARARTRFVGYGSCSFSEPIGDLIGLKLLRSNA